MGKRKHQNEENNEEQSFENPEYNEETEVYPTEEYEVEQQTAIVEIGDRDIIARPMGEGISLSFDLDEEPIFVGEATYKYGIGLPVRKVKELVDRGVVLYAARQFKSSFKGQAYAYYCICRDWETQEPFATVFGSRSLCELIESAALQRFNRPLAFIIRYKQKGLDDSYYYYEELKP